MKFRPAILALVLAIVSLMALLYWSTRGRLSETQQSASTQTNVEGVVGSQNSRVSTPVTSNSPTTKAVTPLGQLGALVGSKEAKTLEILSRENNVPIVFYGKVEDQFGNPVVGAEITGSTIIYSGTSSGSKTVTATSDSNGNFTLDAGKGESLGVMLRKPGYELATTGTDFKYSHLFENYYVPDPRNPTVIKMWKLQGAEHLTGFDIRTEVPIEGTPVFFDLQTGRQVRNGGDVSVTLSSSPKPNLVEEDRLADNHPAGRWWHFGIQRIGVTKNVSGP